MTDWQRHFIICPRCRGERRIKGKLCPRCDGGAQIQRTSLRHGEYPPFEPADDDEATKQHKYRLKMTAPLQEKHYLELEADSFHDAILLKNAYQLQGDTVTLERIEQ